LKYAEMGWEVFPLAARTKKPCTRHGVKDASKDPAVITAWWTKWPNANVAIACGPGSGVYVVDVDVNLQKGIDGRESLKEFPPLPATVTQRTPRGGFHSFYKAENPPANRNDFRPGIDIRCSGYYVVAAPSVLDPYPGCPSGGTYSWLPGYDPWTAEVEEYPDCMRPTEGAVWKNTTMTPGKAPVTTIATQGSLLVIDRASKYLQRVDPAVQGLGGHAKLFWAAQCMVHGFCLSDSDAYRLLSQSYNPMCQPPWDLTLQKDERDFRRKITEARKNPPRDKKIGWLLEDSLDAPAPNVKIDLDAILANAGVKPTANASGIVVEPAAPSAELEFLSAPAGLLGKICSWINANSIRQQPFLSVGATLAFLGAVYGRKICDQQNGRTNLYCMGIAESSAGKNIAQKKLRTLAMESGAIEVLGGTDLASDTAIEDRVGRFPSSVFLLDEIGHLICDITDGKNQNRAMIIATLMKMYSAADDVFLGREYADAENQRIIACPNLCIYGASTPDKFADGLTPEQFKEGWLGRCLIFNSSSYPKKRRDWIPESPPKDICEEIRYWFKNDLVETDGHSISTFAIGKYAKAPPVPKMIPIDDDAEELYRALEDDAMKRQGRAEGYLWSKAEENARRIGLIYAASLNHEEPRITRECADYACRLMRFLLASFREQVAPKIISGTVERQKLRIYHAVKSFGKNGCSRAVLTRKTQWANKRQRIDLIDDMVDAGILKIEATATGGSTIKAIGNLEEPS
jgi:hypothetical protein